MPYTNPPANPQIDLSNPLAPTLQSYVLFDGATPRNIINNSLPRRWAGLGSCNFGEDAVLQTNQFTPDATPSTALRFANNSKSLAYPHSGICASTVRNSNNQAMTHFAIFQAQAIDGTYFNGGAVKISGSGGAVYGNYGFGGTPSDGLGIAAISGTNTAYLTWWSNNGGPLFCADNSGVKQCPVVAGHWYLAAIAIGQGYGPFTRYYLYDLTTNALVSPTGDQFFDAGYGVRGANTMYGNWFPQSVNQPDTDHLIFPDAGGVIKLRLAGIDNQVWDTTVGTTTAAPPAGIVNNANGIKNTADYVRNNPYIVLTGTRNSSGTPPASLIAPAGGGTYPGETSFVAGSTLSGVPSLPQVAVGDSIVAKVDESSVTITASKPVGAPHDIVTWKLYGTTTYPPNNGEVALVSAAALPFIYSPPTTQNMFYQVTGTDSAGAVYTYPVLFAAKRTHRAVRFFLGGNSILTGTGSVASAFVGAGTVAQANGFDLAITTQAIDGSYIEQWSGNQGPTGRYGTVGGSSITQLDWYLARSAQELAETGNSVDAVILQLSGNSPYATSAQYASVATKVLAGTGDANNYTVATSNVYFAAGPLQLAGHPVDANAAIVSTADAAMVAAAATFSGNVRFVGLAAQQASIDYPTSYYGGHPNSFVAGIEGAGWVQDYLGLGATLVSTDPGIANVKKNTHYTINGTSYTGSYDPITGQYTDPGAANVKAGTSYQFGGTTSAGSYDPVTGNYTDPGPANVKAGTNYKFGGIAQPGTFDPVTGRFTDPGAANVKIGTSYQFGGTAQAGSFDPVTGQYTDPGQANVATGTAYKFAGATKNGTLTASASPTAQQIATAVWQDALTGTDFATAGSVGALLMANLDAKISTRAAGSDTATLLTRLGTPATASLSGDLAALTTGNGLFLGGTVTASVSASSFTVAFAGAAPQPSLLAGLYCCNTTSPRAPEKAPISSATVVDATHLTLNFAAPFAISVGDAVLVG